MSEQRPVAIVTGAASNIGLACAQRFAATHTVIMADIADATQQAASLPHAVAVRVNVGEFDSCLNLVAEARKYERIDAVVHSAGITRPACSILDMPVEEWENVIKVNLTGAFFLPRPASLRCWKPGRAPWCSFLPGPPKRALPPSAATARKPKRITAHPRRGSSRSSSRWQWSLPPTESE